jgi:hypothetical protein
LVDGVEDPSVVDGGVGLSFGVVTVVERERELVRLPGQI